MKKTVSRIVVAALLLAPFVALSGEPDKAQAPKATYATTPLEPIIEHVSARIGRSILVSERVPAEVVTGSVATSSISYSEFLTILRNNGLATVDDGKTISIVDQATIRQFPIRTIYEDDGSIDDGEFVTRVVRVRNTVAAVYVPILRPMLPPYGFLSAHAESNSITIVDRYGNVKRIAGLIEKMDASAAKPHGDAAPEEQ